MTARDKHKGNRATDPGAEFAAQLERFPPWGELVTCSMSGTLAQAFDHGLGRRFEAVIVVGQGHGIDVVGYDAATVEILGYDATKKLVLQPDSAATGDVTVWVF